MQTNEGILFHDENNRDLERTMQHLAENTLAHNTAIELIRNQFQMLQVAIRERI
jgi:flagellar basal body rod protein FlgB